MIRDYTAHINWQTKVVRASVHVPLGIITVMAFLLGILLDSPLIGLGLGFACLVGFLIFEINEDRHVHDMAFLDIFGYLVGLYGSVLVLFFVSKP